MSLVFPLITLENVINIKQVVSIFYFEYARDFVFKGESHNFWEFLYVDKGEVEVLADTEGYRLEQGEIIFHKPNEFHSLWANGEIAPNLIVISFYCTDPAISFFNNKILKIGDSEKKILANIIKERTRCFDGKLNQFITEKDKKQDELFGAQQLIRIYLELLLIQLFRSKTMIQNLERISYPTRQRAENELIRQIICFMHENISHDLHIDTICARFSFSRTRIKELFKDKMGIGLIHYFTQLKIEKAKELIRESTLNFTEIAESLGFSSIHYFSNVFKKIVDMRPSEYAKSVKLTAELPDIE